MNKSIGNSWDKILKEEFNKPYFKSLEERIDKDYKEKIVHPNMDNIFMAFKLTPIEKIKVVILGQDPYHNFNEAMGLAFSVPENVKIPPSLVNIYKEMEKDVSVSSPKSGDLTKLAFEGVFLLNTTLTVIHNEPLSHYNLGWETFTDRVIELIDKAPWPICFILWGRNARDKKRLITNKNHLIIESAHPSPLSAYNGFFNSKPFSKANEFLMNNEVSPVDWSVIE